MGEGSSTEGGELQILPMPEYKVDRERIRQEQKDKAIAVTPAGQAMAGPVFSGKFYINNNKSN